MSDEMPATDRALREIEKPPTQESWRSPLGGFVHSKWGPEFPSSSCNAFEDCYSDGVCHDPDQCGIRGPNFPEDGTADIRAMKGATK
jgi:hypothetical protein